MEKRATLLGALVVASLVVPGSGALAADMQRSQDRIHQDAPDRTMDRDMTGDRTMDRDMAGERGTDRDMERDRTQAGREPGGAAGGMQAQARFQDLDRNGDGSIERDELQARSQLSERLQNQWQQADANGDGRVDRAEFAQFEQQQGQGPQGQGPTGGGAPPTQ